MSDNKRKIGAEYEKLAGQMLEKQGFRILQYNYRCPRGEIDIVAKDGDYLVFCEVKCRRSTGKGYASEAVDRKKQRTISLCALYYLREKKLSNMPCRFDVVCFDSREPVLIKDAFLYVGRQY